MEISGLKQLPTFFEVFFWGYIMLQLYQEYGTMLLVIVEDPTIAIFIQCPKGPKYQHTAYLRILY